LKKQKANRGSRTLLEVEAEEEEEEEGVAGLEDFGFTLESKKKAEDEDEDDNAEDEDFENIVDDVSDNEGDEEAGETARKAMMRLEEKQRHKDIMRRMREGYDGKRGGIAGGIGGARGNLRFDQLVAADNKDDAKRLGLLNDDELDSDVEGEDSKENDDEVEDEMVLLDKVLKDRYLNRTDIPEEEFSDSENEEDTIEEDSAQNVDDGEDVEQKNLAKRFARRARMNRLMEIYGDEKEFSQSGLLEQDEDMQKELKSIRSVHNNRSRRQSSLSSSGTGSNSQPIDINSNSRRDEKSSINFLSSSSSLTFALSKNRINSKRKLGFLGSNANKKSKGLMRPKAGGIALGHVVFASDSQNAPTRRSTSLPLKPSAFVASKKRSISDTIGKKKHSLWSKVATNGFKKPRGFSAN